MIFLLENVIIRPGTDIHSFIHSFICSESQVQIFRSITCYSPSSPI